MAIPVAGAWFSAVAALLVLFLLRRLGRPRPNLPPGPRAWPVIGNLDHIGPQSHRSLHVLSQKYGPIMHIWLGSKSLVVGSSVKMAKAFLKIHDGSLASRPRTAAGKYAGFGHCNIVWAPYSPYWRQVRKVCLTELFSPKSLGSYEYIRKEEIRIMANELYSSSSKTIFLKEYLNVFNLNIISRMVLGKTYVKKTQNAIITPDEFKWMLDEFLLLNSGFLNIGDFIPWLQFLDLQGYVKRMKVVSKKFDRFLEHVLNEHGERRKGFKDYVAKDMVDLLLQAADNPTRELKLQRHNVKAITQDLLIGGTQSSAITVEWAMSELLKKPQVLKKAQEELDKVVGTNRWVEEQDMVQLPYIKAIVKETMRLHPALPTLIPRESREDCKIEGYDLPKGTQVALNVWAIGRDPTVWVRPNEFEPERFIGGPTKDIDVHGHDFELLPFGAGRRMCPGYPLGLKVILSSVANLVHGFNWKLPGTVKEQDLNMEETGGLSIAKKLPLEAALEPRLPLHLYSPA
ncbi:flavonoid 3'-monooxygenase [Neltuma alba]|uniref:flavonoid 3'-monooxygenase n=1 Tax=Neltuma alba TaxID=207710 RepID=UPI0010A565C3|nr:flavonoid 3'-monooxygenase-like [Prosopis alba]